jgi:hypothetical protein
MRKCGVSRPWGFMSVGGSDGLLQVRLEYHENVLNMATGSGQVCGAAGARVPGSVDQSRLRRPLEGDERKDGVLRQPAQLPLCRLLLWWVQE